MYVKRNIAARSRNHFALETIYSLYVAVELHAAVHYIKILRIAQKCFTTNLRHRQKCKLYILVIERNYILNNLHCFHTLLTNAEIKQCSFAHGLL
jgi:hypothetical protein